VRGLPPNPLASVAAAATPVVAAALVTVALLAGGCEGRRASPPASGPPAAGPPGSPAPPASPTGTPGGTPVATSAGPTGGGRVLVLVGAQSLPRARIHDPASPHAAGLPLELPTPGAHDRLATVVVGPDGRLAAVTQGGLAWTAPNPLAAGDGAEWVPLPVALDRQLPGPVLGAAWSSDATRLILLAGAPGSGTRRTALIFVPLDGAPATTVEVPLEADGPAIAALPDGRVAFVGRDLRDRGALARIAPSGSFVTLPVAARSVAAGGDLVALVDDVAVRIGTLAELDRGALPTEPLPLDGTAGVGALAIAPDGSGVAVVRLDDAGAAERIDVLRRVGDRWRTAWSIGLDPADGTAIPAWLR